MRKIFTFLIILISIPVFGQNNFIGIKGGISWTNVNTDNFIHDNESRNGFAGGLTYEYEFKNNFHAELDLVYAQKGFKNNILFVDETGNPIGKQGTIDFNYDYLTLPIKGGFSIGNNFAGFLNLGLVPSFLINAETVIPTFENVDGESSDVTDRATEFDFGGLIEIGASYKFHQQFLLFTSFAYQQSFMSITNENYFSDGEAKHYGMTLSIGFKYALKKE